MERIKRTYHKESRTLMIQQSPNRIRSVLLLANQTHAHRRKFSPQDLSESSRRVSSSFTGLPIRHHCRQGPAGRHAFVRKPDLEPATHSRHPAQPSVSNGVLTEAQAAVSSSLSDKKQWTTLERDGHLSRIYSPNKRLLQTPRFANLSNLSSM